VLPVPLLDYLTGRHGRGCLRNPKDPRDYRYDVDRLAGLASSGFPKDLTYWQFARNHVTNQGPTSTCVGQGAAYSLALYDAASRPDGLWTSLSALDIYWHARYVDRMHATDGGAHLRSAFKAISKRGACELERWPFSINPLMVNRQPCPDALMHGYPRAGGRYVQVFELGSLRVDALRAALAAGYFPVVALNIDDAFCQDVGPAIIEKPYTGKYWHAMCLIGYKTDDIYGVCFEVVNSWGIAWRSGGRAWLSEQYIRSASMCADLTIYHGWKS
jgi:hypothetical protein